MTRPGPTYFVPTAGNWSGGGHSVISNFRFAAERHPRISFTDGEIQIINRNFPSLRTRSRYVLIPQNAWAWGGPTFDLQEKKHTLALRAMSELAIRRSLGVIRVGSSIPSTKAHATLLPNPLDRQFEDAWAEVRDAPPLVAEPYLVSIGSMHGYRGLEQLLKAYARYRQGGGTLQLHLVGAGRASYVAAIARLAANTPGVVLHSGSQPRSTCIRWLRHANAAILPSHVEASPISLLEALAVQRLVIASDIAGHRETVPFGTSQPEYFSHLDPSNVAELMRRAEPESDHVSDHDLASFDFREAERTRWADKLMNLLDETSAAAHSAPGGQHATE